jgi:hypothetical protein
LWRGEVEDSFAKMADRSNRGLNVMVIP